MTHRARACPVCGPDFFGASGPHSEVCTPGLRALVRAANKWAKEHNETACDRFDNCSYVRSLHRAVARFRKERGRTR